MEQAAARAEVEVQVLQEASEEVSEEVRKNLQVPELLEDLPEVLEVQEEELPEVLQVPDSPVDTLCRYTGLKQPTHSAFFSDLWKEQKPMLI